MSKYPFKSKIKGVDENSLKCIGFCCYKYVKVGIKYPVTLEEFNIHSYIKINNKVKAYTVGQT